jgi:two-component system, LytTR family, sensor kinase
MRNFDFKEDTMYPKSKYVIPLEIAFWIGLYIIWVFIFQNRTIIITRTLGIQFCYLVFIALNYYLTINYFIPQILNKNNYVSFLVLFILSTALAALMRAIVSYFITIYLYHLPPPDFVHLYPVSLLNIFIWTGILVAGKMIIDKVRNQRYSEAVEKERMKNELDFLKAQHDPHFLFNSLNSLYFQIDKNNSDARGTLMKLSDLLRYQLYECNVGRIPIEKELNYLDNYIELQRLRLDDKYAINFITGDNVKDFEIAPLLIIPLVENSFKHISHFTGKPNEININLQYKQNTFICNVSNTTESSEQVTIGGIGLNNLKRRLELLYPEKYEMNAVKNSDKYDVTLKIEPGEN